MLTRLNKCIFILLLLDCFRDKPANVIILNQSVIDFFSGAATFLTEIFNTLGMVSDSRLSKNIYCGIWLSQYIMGSLITSSIYNLILLTIERYLAITNPMKYDKEKVLQRLPWVLLTAWLSGISYNIERLA